MELLSAFCLKVGLISHRVILGPWSRHCSLWDWGEDIGVPHALQLRLWVLNQTTDLGKGQGGEVVPPPPRG